MVFSRLATMMQHIVLTVMKVLAISVENFKAKTLIVRIGVAFEILNKKAEKRRRSRLRIKLLQRELGLNFVYFFSKVGCLLRFIQSFPRSEEVLHQFTGTCQIICSNLILLEVCSFTISTAKEKLSYVPAKKQFCILPVQIQDIFNKESLQKQP